MSALRWTWPLDPVRSGALSVEQWAPGSCEASRFLSFSLQKTGGAPTASHRWLPRTSAQASRAAPWRLSTWMPLGPWAVRPAAPCCAACLRGALHPCSQPPCATPTRLSSLWTPRPQRYWLWFAARPGCDLGFVPGTSNWSFCVSSAIRKTFDFSYVVAKYEKLEN